MRGVCDDVLPKPGGVAAARSERWFVMGTLERLGWGLVAVAIIWLSGRKIDWGALGIAAWYTLVGVVMGAGAYFTMARLHEHRHHGRE
jgi:hypothetical protein